MSNDSSDNQPSPPPSSKKVGWGPLAAILVVVLSYLGVQIVASLLVALYPQLRGWSEARATDWLSNTVTAQFVYVLLNEALLLGALGLFLRHRRASFRSLGLTRPKWVDLAYMLAAIPIYFGLYLLVLSLLGSLIHIDMNQEQDIGFKSVVGNRDLIMTFVSLVVLPPLVEEIIFRGFLFGGLRKVLGFAWATIGTSLLFAAPHLLEGGDGKLLWIAGIDTLVLSFVLCYLREKTGRLWASIGLHAFKNGLAFLSLFVLGMR